MHINYDLWMKNLQGDAHQWQLIEAKFHESISDMSYGELLCISSMPPEVAENMPGQRLLWGVSSKRPQQPSQQYHVVVDSITTQPKDAIIQRRNQPNSYAYSIGIKDALCFLKLNTTLRTFYDLEFRSIVNAVLERFQTKIFWDFSGIKETIPRIDFVLQYNQTDFDFLQHLCFDQGVTFFIRHNGSMPTIYFGNHPTLFNKSKLNIVVNQSNNTYPYEELQRSQMLSHEFCEAHNFNKSTQPGVSEVALSNYNPDFSDEVITQKWKNRGKSYVGAVHQFPSNLMAPDYERKKVRELDYILNACNKISTFHLNHPYLRLGLVHDVVINSRLNILELSSQMFPYGILPTEIEHYYSDYQSLLDPNTLEISILPDIDGAKPHAHIQVTAIDWEYRLFLKPPCSEKPHMNGVYNAIVVGTGPEGSGQRVASTDARAQVRFVWDSRVPEKPTAREVNKYCPPLRIRHIQMGQRVLPHMGDEALIMFENSQSQRPVIVGFLYNELTKPPFNLKKNPYLMGIKTSYNATSPAHVVYSNNRAGHEHVVMKSAGNVNKVVGAPSCTLKPNEINFHQKAGRHIRNSIQGDIEYKAHDGNIIIKANTHLSLNVNNSEIILYPDRIEINGNDIELISKDGKVGQLAVVGNQHTCPKNNPDDSQHKGGPILSGSADTLINGQGVARVGDQAKCESSSVDVITEGNSGITVNGRPVAIVGSATSHGGQVSSGSGLVEAGQAVASSQAIDEDQKNYDIQVRISMVASPKYAVLVSHGLIHVKEFLKKKEPEEFNPTSLDYDEGHQQAISYTNPFTTIKHIPGGKYQLFLEKQRMGLSIMAVNKQPFIPYYSAPITVPDHENANEQEVDKDRVFDIQLLWPMMMLNCRNPNIDDGGYKEAQAEGARELDPMDIRYFKENGNNVTIFIHGYNVPCGTLGHEMAEGPSEGIAPLGIAPLSIAPLSIAPLGIDLVGLGLIDTDLVCDVASQKKSLAIAPSAYKSEILRNSNIVKNQIKANGNDLFGNAEDFDEKKVSDLNGTAAFNWAVNMENNLNKATGQFDAEKAADYSKFSRMLHVTWSGDHGSIQYMESVHQALNPMAGDQVANIVTKLIDHGIQVNIIAHSLGNGLLLETMRELDKNHPGKMIDHIFMWDAAVPNNVFNRPKMLNNKTDPWDFKSALNAVKKVTILHSLNDNILGPMLNGKENPANTDDVDQVKSVVEWAVGYACELFDLKSIYLVAMTAKKETHLLLTDQSVQNEVYQGFLSQHPELIFHGGSDEEKNQKFKEGMYLPTLEEQIKAFKNNHREAFKTALDRALEQFDKDIHDPTSRLTKMLKYHSLIDYYVARMLDNATAIHKVLEVLISHCFLHHTFKFESAERALYLVTMINDKRLQLHAAPAMGYKGPDRQNNEINSLIDSGKLQLPVDQSKWLFDHSGMKIPTKDLMENVYKGVLLNPKLGLEHFGLYHKGKTIE